MAWIQEIYMGIAWILGIPLDIALNFRKIFWCCDEWYLWRLGHKESLKNVKCQALHNGRPCCN